VNDQTLPVVVPVAFASSTRQRPVIQVELAGVDAGR
jgi:hypothetical protein